MKFDDLITTKKGNLGESIVDRYFMEHGWTAYPPINSGSHMIDRFYVLGSTLIMADIKTKAARNIYDDTGIDMVHFNRYKALDDKFHCVALFFVDEVRMEVYGNFLKTLEIRNGIYPWEQFGIRYYPMVAMKHVCWISAADASDIQALNSRNYEYVLRSDVGTCSCLR